MFKDLNLIVSKKFAESKAQIPALKKKMKPTIKKKTSKMQSKFHCEYRCR